MKRLFAIVLLCVLVPSIYGAEAVYCVQDNSSPIWGNIGVVTFEPSCRDYCKKYNSFCGDAVRQVTEAEFYRIQSCVQGGETAANCLGIPSDKRFIFGSRVAAKQVQKLEMVALQAYQASAIPIVTLLGQIEELSSGVVNRQVSLDYAENKLWTYLAKAKAKLTDYGQAIEKFESIQVEVSSDLETYKRNYYNVLKNVGDSLAGMINDAEEQIHATREDNDDLLNQLWVSSKERLIFIMESEKSMWRHAQLHVAREQPQFYYLESLIQVNTVLVELNRFFIAVWSDGLVESSKQGLYKAKFALKDMAAAHDKGQGLLLDFSKNIGRQFSAETEKTVYDHYSALFGNESAVNLILDEYVNDIFSLYGAEQNVIDEKFDEWWSRASLKLELVFDQRVKLHQQQLEILGTLTN